MLLIAASLLYSILLYVDFWITGGFTATSWTNLPPGEPFPWFYHSVLFQIPGLLTSLGLLGWLHGEPDA